MDGFRHHNTFNQEYRIHPLIKHSSLTTLVVAACYPTSSPRSIHFAINPHALKHNNLNKLFSDKLIILWNFLPIQFSYLLDILLRIRIQRYYPFPTPKIILHPSHASFAHINPLIFVMLWSLKMAVMVWIARNSFYLTEFRGFFGIGYGEYGMTGFNQTRIVIFPGSVRSEHAQSPSDP